MGDLPQPDWTISPPEKQGCFGKASVAAVGRVSPLGAAARYSPARRGLTRPTRYHLPVTCFGVRWIFELAKAALGPQTFASEKASVPASSDARDRSAGPRPNHQFGGRDQDSGPGACSSQSLRD